MTAIEPLFAQQSDAEKFGTFSKRDFFRVVFKHKWAILICFVVVTCVTFALLAQLPNSYIAEAKVLIKTSEDATPSFFGGIAPIRERPDADPVNRVIETEMELIETAELSGRVVDELNIKFKDVYRKPWKVLLDPVMDAFDYCMQRFAGVSPDPQKRGRADTITAFNRAITVAPIKSKSAETNSNIVGIRLRLNNDKLSQEALDKLLDHYIRFDVPMNEEAARKAYDIVKKELETSKQQVAEAREKLRQFSAVGLARRDLRTVGRSEPLLADPSAPGGSEPRNLITTPRDVSTIDRLKARLIDAKIELANLKLVYSERDAARIRALDSLIADLEKQIQAEVATAAGNDAEVDALERDVRAADARFLDLDKKLEQIALYRQMNQQHVGNRILIERPVVPRDSDFKFKLLIGVGASAASLIVGLAIAGLLEYADHTLRNKAQVMKHLGLDVLATIPKAGRRERKRIIDHANP